MMSRAGLQFPQILKLSRAFLSSIALLFLASACLGHAAPGDSVIVVYNSALPASKEIAFHYARKREVPENQIFSFDLPIIETISRSDYKRKLQEPLWNELLKQKLFAPSSAAKSAEAKRPNLEPSKIRYAVLCYGVPVKIPAEPGLDEESEKLTVELRRNEAAVDSELATLPWHDSNLPVTGPFNNPCHGFTNHALLNPANGLLMVARLDGPSPEIAKGLVDKAVEAEQNGLWGRAYFDARGLTNSLYLIGDQWIKSGADFAKRYGFDTVIDNAEPTFSPSTPLPDIALYFGWYDQNISGPFTSQMADFRPGAIAYHLHSFSAKELRSATGGWAGPLLAKGATATVGCTEEPYLQMTLDIPVFLSRLLFVGFSFGEAAYAGQRFLSWQNTVVGDPLYTPFGKSQKERFQQLEASNDPLLPWSIMMWIQFRLMQGASLTEIESFYQATPLMKTNALLQAKLAEVYQAQGKIFAAVEPFQTALKLPAAPLEKLRISLAAASLFTTLGRTDEAYDIYKKVIESYPNYPGRKDVYEHLAKVAEQLNKKDEATEYLRLSKGS